MSEKQSTPRNKTGRELGGTADNWHQIRVGTADANAAHEDAREDQDPNYDRWFDRVTG